MVSGTAYEGLISEDVLARLYPVIEELGIGYSNKSDMEAARDIPVTALIGIVWACGIDRLTEAEGLALIGAAEYLRAGSAYERPFPEEIIQRIAPAAASTGFLTVGGFYEAIKDRPVSTMLRWALMLGR
jgi:hypothetical protein